MLNPLQVLQELNESSSFLQPLAFTLLVIFLVLLYTWDSSTKTTTQKSSPPPFPPKLPITGNLHQLGSYPHRSIQALSQRHGPLMLLHFGSVPVLLVSSAEAAREILKTHDLTFSGRPKSTIFEKLLYNYKDVAITPYGEYWRQVRSICVSNILSNTRVRSFRSLREEETKSMIRNINDSSSSSSSSVLNLTEMFVGLTNDVVCRVALGRKYNDGEGGESGRMFKKLLGEFTDLLGTVNFGDYIPWLSWLSHINGLGAKLDKVAKQLDDFIDTAVQEHMNHSSKSGDDDQKDFLDILLAIQKENLAGIPIDRVSIKGIILWTMTELLRHPRVMNKLQNEVRGIVGNKTDVITEDALVEMHYLKAVTKETLRLHPPLPLLFPRMSTRDVEVNGYNIKANTQVFFNAWQIGRDPKVYDKPEEYEPERFLNNGIDYKGNDFELIPYGAGRRACPGIQFAMAVNEIALANIVHKFDWAYCPVKQVGRI
ncbi:unnamed protein product [Prunus armeniaca]